MSKRDRRGFTLIELMITVGVIGLLATIAIPTFLRLQLRSKVAEVKGNLGAIRVAEEAYFNEFGAYASAVPAVPTTVGPTRTAWTLIPTDNHGFNTLGFAPAGNVFYQYSVATDGFAAYTMEARSDLDGDSAYNSWGYVKPAPGTSTGVAGPLGACPATGVFNDQSGSQDLLDSLGPCDAQSGRSEF